MIKKIALILAIAAASSFATWDKYAPLDAGTFQLRVFALDRWVDDASESEVSIGARYTIIQGLEVGIHTVGFTIWSYDNSESFNETDTETGLSPLEVGVRYFLPINLGFFLDVSLPTGDEDMFPNSFSFHEGLQYSVQPVDAFKIGAEAGLKVFSTADRNSVDINQGTELNLGTEFKYTFGLVAPLVGFDYISRLTETKTKYETEEGSSETYKWNNDDSGITFRTGLDLIFNQTFTLGARFQMQTGDYYGGDMILGASTVFLITL